MDRNRLGHRLDEKPYELRGRNGRADSMSRRTLYVVTGADSPFIDCHADFWHPSHDPAGEGVASIWNVL